MKFLTDEQFPQPFVELLRKVDWDIRTVYEEAMEGEADDCNLLIRARDLGRVFITYDLLRGRSGARVAAELVSHGGKIIQIRGGPDQPFMRSLGRLLFYHQDWQPFLANNDGVVVISDIRNPCKLMTTSEYVQTSHKIDRMHFEEYLNDWGERRGSALRQKPQDPQQPELFERDS